MLREIQGGARLLVVHDFWVIDSIETQTAVTSIFITDYYYLTLHKLVRKQYIKYFGR